MRDDTLTALLRAELALTPPPEVVKLAAQLAARADGAAAAVLYYGSALRSGAPDGVLDFYVLLDRIGSWPQSRLAALGNRWLPPNVGYVESGSGNQRVRAKFAVMGVDQFRRRMREASLDTTLWARFSQPCRCVFERTPADRDTVIAAVREAALTAARWAAALGPPRGHAADFWRALYSRTYDAELRVEKSGRGDDLVAYDPGHYAQLLPAAWHAAGIDFDPAPDGTLAPQLPPAVRVSAARRWARRRRLGKLLNFARLLKAAMTFEGAVDYVAWKVERQSGYRMPVRAWQRRHPLLALPGVYWHLRRRGVLR